ncbi:MAG: hypothetical protein IJ005_09765 [Bacteroidales bacterium]|nr:hypothetical protein [Bacteroidales bacterium]
MKILDYILILFLCLPLSVSCAGDLGNYEYEELDEPQIFGIEDVQVLTYERLQFSPSFGDGAVSEDMYDFEWKAVSQSGSSEPVVIGTSRELDYEVLLSPDAYTLFFTMTERKTGLFWRRSVNLLVSSSMSEGWMVLCSDEGRTRLDVVSMVTGETYRDILKDNGTPRWNGPRKIIWLSDKTDASSPYYLLTDEGATRLGKDSFEWRPEYDFSYEVASQEHLLPECIVSAGFGKVVVSGTNAHYCEIMGFDGLYGSSVNKGFPVAPFVGANVLATQIYAAVYLLYDTENRRFMAFCPLLATNDLGALDPLTDMESFAGIADGMAPGAGQVGTAFDGWPKGRELIYMENTRYDPGNGKMGMTYAVLNGGGAVEIYGIQLGDILLYADCTYVIGKGYYGDLSGCPGVDSDDCIYAFSSLKNCMYYAVGSTVYMVDLSVSPLQARVQLSFPGETVTCMKFNLYQRDENMQQSYDLIVGTLKDGQGVLRVYEGRESDGDFTMAEPRIYDGFAEIVDVAYKERLY